MAQRNRFSEDTAVAQRLAQLSDTDLYRRARVLDADLSGRTLLIPFFGRRHRVSAAGVTDATGHAPTPAVANLLLDYVLQCPVMVPEAGAWITFREFSGAGPLMGYFVGNTNKLIESHFAGDAGALEACCSSLGGKVVQGLPGVDLCMEIPVLPRLSIRMAFNDRDEDFPAQCSLLFQKSAETYLPMKSMAVAGTWLAGKLVGSRTG